MKPKKAKSAVKIDAAFRRLVLKIEVLSFYGKHGRLQCCWRGCNIKDPDAIVLDHINDDGNQNRSPCGRRLGGDSLYRYLKRENFPKGYQSLCGSHNLCKETRRRRSKIK